MSALYIISILWIFQLAGYEDWQKTEFDRLVDLDWKQVFEYVGNTDWKNKWFVDGKHARIQNMEDGMHFCAGPVERDDASHAVLWTKQNFTGDLKIEYDFTRIDDMTKYVNIIYIQATGKGSGAYDKDITTWSELREVPSMRTYFNNMELWHVSYAAFGNDDRPDKLDYVRARRYPVLEGQKFKETQVGESYEDTGLFNPNQNCQIVLIKKGQKLHMRVQAEDVERYFSWDYSDYPTNP